MSSRSDYATETLTSLQRNHVRNLIIFKFTTSTYRSIYISGTGLHGFTYETREAETFGSLCV